MQSLVSSKNTQCLREDILLYLEGEMSPGQELVFEEHIADCKSCLEELNEHKKMLCALDIAFERDSVIEPPKDFAKVVAARAESNVTGLRHPKERSLTLFFCLFLFLIASAGILMGSEGAFALSASITEKVYSVATLAAHFLYDISLGVAVVLRSLSHQIAVASYTFGIISVFLLFVTATTGYVFRLQRHNRR